jgi:hypothetical protein
MRALWVTIGVAVAIILLLTFHVIRELKDNVN